MASFEDGTLQQRWVAADAVADKLAQLASRLVLIERTQAAVECARLGQVYSMVTLAVSTEAFVTATELPARKRAELAFRSVRAEISTTLHRSEREVDRMINDAIALNEHLPNAHRALNAGVISIAHARIIIDEAALLSADPAVLAAFERQLTVKAMTQPASRLRQAARRLRERLQPTAIDQRFADAAAERRVAFEAAEDGMAWLHLYLPVVEARMILDRADALAQAQQRMERESVSRGAANVEGVATESPTPDEAEPAQELTMRTLPQIRADVMRDLLLENCPANLPPIGPRDASKSTVRITIPALTLLGLSEEPATLEGYGPIDIDTARQIASKVPSLQRVITDPIRSTVLDIDRRAYPAAADLKRWLEVRDESCRFPGCGVNVSRSELDHTVAWADGGATKDDNLAHLCRKHHHLKHETAWSLAQLPHGVLRWVSPLGRIHYTHPATQMRASGPPPPSPRKRLTTAEVFALPNDSAQHERAPY